MRLLGPPELAGADGSALEFPTRKAFALLAWLVLHPDRPHPRERLMALLWEESPEAQARGSLRQALFSLRRTLGDVVLATADQVRLVREAFDCDLWRFEARAADGSPPALEEAVGLVRGELLEGFAPRAAAFEDAVEVLRRRVRERALEALRALAAHEEAAGRPDRAGTLALRLLALDPLDEAAHRRLMVLQARAGRRTEALRQYALCRERLRRELGAEPSEATRALHERIQAGAFEATAARGEARAGRPGGEAAPAGGEAAPPGAGTAPPGAEAADVPELRWLAALAVVLPETLDPASTEHALRAVADGVAAHGGEVAGRSAWALTAVFGARAARGREIERAVEAAAALRDRLAPVVALRVGVAAGEAPVRPGGAGVEGPVPGRAAGLAAAADPGEVRLQEAVHRALPSRFQRTWDAGAWRLLRVAADEGDLSGPLFGREGERSQLETALASAARLRRGAVLVLRGEPGIGKTRLAYEAVRIARTRGWAVVTVGGRSERESVAALLAGLLGTAGEDAASRFAAWAAAAGRLDAVDAALCADLLELPPPGEARFVLGALPPAARRERVGRLAARLAEDRAPLLLTVDDVQGLGGEALDLMMGVAEAAVRAPVVVLVTSGPEGAAFEAAFRTRRLPLPRLALDLPPLEDEAGRALARARGCTDAAAIETRVARAGGNPFLLERLCELDDPAQDVPGAVRGLVQARLDALTPAQRSWARAAAVLGSALDLPALRHVSADPEADPAPLVGAGLMVPTAGGLAFAHALFREAVAAGCLPEERARLHRRAAGWYAGRDPEASARHLEAAGDPSAAAGAWREAAEARRRGQRHRAALEAIRHGLEVAPAPEAARLHRLEGEVLLELGESDGARAAFEAALAAPADDETRCLAWVGLATLERTIDRFEEAESALARAEPIADRLGDAALRFRVHHRRASVRFGSGDVGACLVEQRRALELARAAGSAEAEALALGGQGDALFAAGRMREAAAAFQACLELARRHALPRIEVAHASMAEALALYELEPATALSAARRAVRTAARVGDLRAEVVAGNTLSDVTLQTGDWAACAEASARYAARARQLGSDRFRAAVRANEGYALARLGRREAAEEALEEAGRVVSAGGGPFLGPTLCGLRADLAATDSERDRWLAEGWRHLAGGALALNDLVFHPLAMHALIRAGAWDAVTRHADALEARFEGEGLPWVEAFTAWGRAWARWAGAATAEEGRAAEAAGPAAAVAAASARLEQAGLRLYTDLRPEPGRRPPPPGARAAGGARA